MTEPFQEISEIKFPSPLKTGFGGMTSKMSAERTPDIYSMQEGSNMFQDEDDNVGPVEVCPMHSVPDIRGGRIRSGMEVGSVASSHDDS